MATVVVLRAVGAALLALGVVAVFRPVPVHFLARSLSFGVGVLALAYASHLGRRLAAVGGDPPREASWLSPVSVVLVALVAFLSVFWATKDLAQALGRGQALVLERTLAARPGVVVYSTRRLHAPPEQVRESRLPGSEGFRYRYTGLRLLVRSGDRLFLIPETWTRSRGVVLVLRDDETLRLEFARGRT